ncbi:MAG: ferrous iron transport protein B, partial [Oscillospiraceae bacterium]|nr:ferrous iron transport protein B [Oscillospiraceae bacterium]
MTIGFIGNPNCGKTTLFNAYTGANLKVANWPGVTVEKVEGAIRRHDLNIRVVDLPGTYSLTSYTMEEIVSRQFILSDEVDVIINVVDASVLERGLYLTLQLLELGKPVVVALNMMDVVEKRGMEIDLHRLPEMLGVPVIPVSARKRTGLDSLLHAAAHHRDHAGPDSLVHQHRHVGSHAHDHHQEYAMVYSDEIEDQIDRIIPLLEERCPGLANPRWHALKLLEGDREVRERCPLDLPGLAEQDYESRIINEKYAFIDEIVEEVLLHKQRQDQLTERLDGALTHRVWGIPIFLGIMALVFFLTFTVGDWIKGYFEHTIDALSLLAGRGMDAIGAAPIVQSLVIDGVIGGVGTIVTFLPNIFILFLALAFLEDSGYMARVAYVMEGVMSRLGLSGKAFIPMLLGFGCTVPALMASRALESRRDRYKVMLVTPFMSCNARLTIYILFSEMFFGGYAMLAAYSMYLIGIVVAMLVSVALHLLDRKREVNYLLIELPEYKMPDARTVGIYVWDKVKDYLGKAGSTIFLATLLIWLLLNFGPQGYAADMSGGFGAIIGRWLVPFFAPIGLGFWQIAVALIAGISAKEVVV